MPRYFIDLYDGEKAFRDEYGIELESVDEAAEQAAALLPDVARDALPGWEARNFATLVRDEGETVVYRAALLFRGERAGGQEKRPVGCPSETEDLILRSRATREAARRISARLQEDVSELIDVVQHAFSVAAQTRTMLQTLR